MHSATHFSCLWFWLSSSRLYGARGEVASTSAERLGVSPLSMLLGLMKVGSDLCLLLPSGEESPESGSMDDSLDEYNDDGGENDGDLGEKCHGVMEGVCDLGQGLEMTWM